MGVTLREIAIRGLHDRMDVTIPVADNKLVLVGVNGLGKTTVVNILYYVLSQQWHRLADVRFKEIRLSLGRRKLRITKDMLLPSKRQIQRVSRYLPPSLRARVSDAPEFYRLLAGGDYQRIEDDFNISRSYLARYIDRRGSVEIQEGLFESDDDSSLAEIQKYLANTVTSQILYLPTYRRIEQDLRTLLPHFDEDIRDAVSGQLRRQRHARSFVELVQFGMEDVQDRISERLATLKEQARVELNNLAGTYLRDVIRGDADRYQKADIAALEENEVDRILERVEEKTLPAPDKDVLREVIRGIRHARTDRDSVQERYLAHFFSKLVEVHRSQQERAKPLREFVQVCNQYLEGKRLEFDDVEYTLTTKTDQQTGIEMGQLSSGEKQIVSLFSHVYLSAANSLFIIIDEPELSLSVDWQKRLLPDLMQSRRCDFLAAVTHSPFVYDNEFEPFATDLRTCTTLR